LRTRNQSTRKVSNHHCWRPPCGRPLLWKVAFLGGGCCRRPPCGRIAVKFAGLSRADVSRQYLKCSEASRASGTACQPIGPLISIGNRQEMAAVCLAREVAGIAASHKSSFPQMQSPAWPPPTVGSHKSSFPQMQSPAWPPPPKVASLKSSRRHGRLPRGLP
jgi:hypothetical protein